MKLTGYRRGIEIVLFLSVAWAGAVLVWAGQQDGFVIHRIWGDPVRYAQITLPAGTGLAIGVVAMITAISALLHGTGRAAVFAVLCLLGLAPLCWMEIAVLDDIRLVEYEIDDGWIVEQLWAARLVDDAARLIGWSSFALTPVLALLHFLQRRIKPAPIPRALVIS